MVNELHGVYSEAPSTDERAYAKAREALNVDEEMTFTDAELDAFLPKELRRANYDTKSSGGVPTDSS